MKKNKNKFTSSLNAYAKYSSLAFQMMFIILAGVFGGVELDKWLGWKFPVFTVAFSILAVILAIYYAIKDLLK
ncbi:MAG: AtpZ/AtpI family protein [Bacteroidales bacterium]|nr:AtpZ/AtpI family protein [Bacteroidales bacterium]